MVTENRMKATGILELLSAPRLKPYQEQTPSDEDALELYVWVHRIVSACFELVAHLEVGMRNAIDKSLRDHFEQEAGSIPWIFQQPLVNDQMKEAIGATRDRLPASQRNNRNQIVASLSFGFWSGLLGNKHDELWKQCLHRAFPHAHQGRRKSVSIELEAIRKFRNRIAHHDSLLTTDILYETNRIFKLAGYIDPTFEAWMRSVSRVQDVYAQKPHTLLDTVVLAAKNAWPFYTQHHAYICQAGRHFRGIKYMAFYAEGEIKDEIASIKYRQDSVPWTFEYAQKLLGSSSKQDQKIGQIILASRQAGWTAGRYQVFLLTSPQETTPHGQHRKLRKEIPHLAKGRGKAFTQQQRYTSLHALELAQTTEDL